MSIKHYEIKSLSEVPKDLFCYVMVIKEGKKTSYYCFKGKYRTSYLQQYALQVYRMINKDSGEEQLISFCEASEGKITEIRQFTIK